ncbi:hypothetical protein CYMTET_11676, partial [Cymbomonas tetramitiformis]
RDITQPRLAIIFAGSGKKISKWEKEQYDKRVDVYFQRNAWADLLFTCEWAERTWRKHREREGVQVNKKRKIVVPEGGELAVASQAVATACVTEAEVATTVGVKPSGSAAAEGEPAVASQVVDDSRVGNQLKTYVKEERNTFLESSDTAFDEWEFASASHKRIMYTHWCGDAYEKLITEKNHNINQAYIDKGMTLAADGSEDHLLKLKGLEHMEFPKERPAAPPPRLSKKERREAAIAQAIEANTSFSSHVMEAEKVRVMEQKRLADAKAARKEMAQQKKLAGLAKQAAKDAAAALRDAQKAQSLVVDATSDVPQTIAQPSTAPRKGSQF